MIAIPPLVIYAAFLVGFVVVTLAMAHGIGPRKKTPIKQMPYESGMDPMDDARQPFNVRFCLVALLFLMFDVEMLFLLPWAVSAYPQGRVFPEELGLPIFCVMMVFMATLVVAYVYAWKKGVFKWR